MTSLTTGSPATTTSTTGVAPYAIPYAQQNLANAYALSQQPYQAYKGQQNAAFTDMQNQAFNQASNMGITPQTYAASNAAQQATNNLLNAQYNPMQLNYRNVSAPQLQQYQMQQPQNVSTRSFTDPGVAQSYMNPYIQQSLNPQEQALAQQQAQQGTQLDAQATRAGAFGGSRAGLQQVAQNAANQQQMGSLIGAGMNNAYNNAQQQFNAEQGIGLQGQMANQQMGYNTGAQNLGANLAIQQLGAGQNLTAQQLNQANQMGANQQAINQQQYGAGLNLAANQGALSGANALSGIGQNQYGQQIGNIGLLNQFGNQQQNYQQGLLNTQYQNYVNQRNYPYQQAGFFQNAVNGYPVQSGTSVTQPSSPSYIQNAAALGVGMYGASQMFPGMGSAISSYFGYKKGGLVKRYANSGLTSISSALGPALTADPVTLQKEISAAQARGDIQTANALQAELVQQQYITKQAQGLQAAPQAGSYGANPQAAANLAGNGSGQQKMPTPPTDTSGSTQGLPSITDLIKMQKESAKAEHKALERSMQPGQMAVADNASYVNAISAAPISDDVMPSEPAPSAQGTFKSGGVTEVARYAKKGVTTLDDDLPADIQKADRGDNSLDLGAPSTLNTVREDRGLPAVSVGQVRDIPSQQTLTQANEDAQQLQPQSISSAAVPTTAKAAAQQGLSSLGLDFKQVPTLTYDEMVAKLGQRPTINYDELRTANKNIYGNPEDNARQNRALAAFSALPGILSGNQAGRGIAQGLSDFGNTAAKMQEAEDKKRQATAEMNMKLNLAQHAEKLDDWKQNKELMISANKNAQEAAKEEFKAKIEMSKLLKDLRIPGADQAYAAIQAYMANKTPENKVAYDAALLYLDKTHPQVDVASIMAAQSGANTQSNNDIKAQIANIQANLKANEDAAKAIAKIRITPEYSNATRAEQLQMEKDADDSARKGVNAVQVNTGTKSNPAPSVAPTQAKTDSVVIGGKTFTKPSTFTDAQWKAYKESQGIK